jgi:hypothetical protein
MNAIQENRFEMARTVCTYLTNNAAVTADVVGYPVVFQSFCDALNNGEKLALTQGELVRATIDDRNKKIETMMDGALALAGIALAVVNPDKQSDLATKLRVTPGDFTRARLSQRVRQARQICDALRAAVPLEGAEAITPAMLDDLKAKVDAAEKALPNPRTQTARKRAATGEIAATLRDISDILTSQLDRILRPLRKTHPEFYKGYQTARKVVNRPGRRRSTDELKTAAAAPTVASVTDVRSA